MSTFEEDMEEMKKQVTQEVIYYINRVPKLYKDINNKVKKQEQQELKVDEVSQICYDYAEEHENEFGTVFQAELDAVDWDEVIRMIVV